MSYLEVPGARLYYEVTGSGQVLLLIPGGTADASDFAPIVAFLANRYTVVTFDPRGISRSRRANQTEGLSVDGLADDVHRLLMATSAAPAYVFGSSGGGVIALALVARYAKQIRAVVTHEPPVVSLLPDAKSRGTSPAEIFDTYHEQGTGPAMRKFLAYTGMGDARPRNDLPSALQEAMAQRLARMQQNVGFFLAQYLLPITAYVPDASILRAVSSRIVVGVGATSSGQLAHDSALALARSLGTPAVTFPGGHSGYFTHPAEFAQELDALFQSG